MQYFVTGGAGFIGSFVVDRLAPRNGVTVYDNLSEGHRSAVDPRAKFILGRPDEPGNLLNAVQSAKPDATEAPGAAGRAVAGVLGQPRGSGAAV